MDFEPGWRQDFLHVNPYGQHVLFESLELTSRTALVIGGLVTCAICFGERWLTFLISPRCTLLPHYLSRRPFALAAVRTLVYGTMTTLRLLYMLLAMSFNVGLLVIIILSLSLGQFCIEIQQIPDTHTRSAPGAEYLPLRELDGEAEAPALRSSRSSERRSRPSGIRIDPGESNIARADAIAAWDDYHRHERTAPHGWERTSMADGDATPVRETHAPGVGNRQPTQ